MANSKHVYVTMPRKMIKSEFSFFPFLNNSYFEGQSHDESLGVK